MSASLRVYASIVSQWPCTRHDVQEDTMLDYAQVAGAISHLLRRDLIKAVDSERDERTGRFCHLYVPAYAPVLPIE